MPVCGVCAESRRRYIGYEMKRIRRERERGEKKKCIVIALNWLPWVAIKKTALFIVFFCSNVYKCCIYLN